MGGSSDKPDKPGPAAPAEDDDLLFDWLPIEAKSAGAADTPLEIVDPIPPPAAIPPKAAAAPLPAAPAEEPLEIVDLIPPPAPLPPPPPLIPPPPRQPSKPVAASRPVASPPKPAAPPARPVPRPEPPRSRPATVVRPAAAPTPTRTASRRIRVPVAAALAGAGLLVVAGTLLALRSARPPKAVSASPLRVRAGQLLTIRGENFAELQDNAVSFDGVPGRVTRASPTELLVEVPAGIPTDPGADRPVTVAVSSRGHAGEPLRVTSYQPPELKSVTPDVAMPGEEIVLAGRGFAKQSRVTVGGVAGEVLEATPEALRVRVPAVLAAIGAALPVAVSSGPDRSEERPLLFGRLPLLSSVEPRTAAPADVLTLRGKGFREQPAANLVEIGGQRALVVSSGAEVLQVVVPISPGPGGETPVAVRVPDSEHVGAHTVMLTNRGGVVSFRFAAEPFGGAGHDHAALATELGPAFVLSGSGGRTAGERALAAQRRLNALATSLADAKEHRLEIRSEGGSLVIGLAERSEPLLDVTEEDAAAYNEAGDGFRGNAGRTVSRSRLAAWWLAVLRDLAIVMLSDARTRYVAALTPEGRTLAELDGSPIRAGNSGLPRAALERLRPETRQALRAFALRVPPALAAGDAPASTAAAEDPLQLEGTWSGSLSEGGLVKSFSVAFGRGGGTLSYLKPLQFSVALLAVERPRTGSVRFSARIAGGTRYFDGVWDGQTLSGTVSETPQGVPVVARFELRR